MKKSQISLLVLLASLFISEVDAQKKNIRFGLEGGNSILFGDITDESIGDPNAGYVDFGFTTGFMGQYIFKNNVSITFRSSIFVLSRDMDSYEEDLAESLGLSEDDAYYADNLGVYLVGGGSLGVSYIFDMNENWQIEPYLYAGFRALSSPSERFVYQNGVTTNTLEKKRATFYGFSYAPGVRVNWNFGNFTGLYFFAEYEGVQFAEEEMVVALYDNNQLLVNEVEPEFSYGAVTTGIGLTLSLNLNQM